MKRVAALIVIALFAWPAVLGLVDLQWFILTGSQFSTFPWETNRGGLALSWACCSPMVVAFIKMQGWL